MEFDLQSEMKNIKERERERKKATTLYNSDREQRGKN